MRVLTSILTVLMLNSAGFVPSVSAGVAAPAGRSERRPIMADKANVIRFPAVAARFVRLVIHASENGAPCLDELEIYDASGSRNLALAADGAKASASSCLPGYAIHQINHLNDGHYGNDHSWIAATAGEEWAQIELPQLHDVVQVVFSRDRLGAYKDRLPAHLEVQVSRDGQRWETVREVMAADVTRALPVSLTWEALLTYAFLSERDTWERMSISQNDPLSPFHPDRPEWAALAGLDATARTLRQMEALIERLAHKGLDVTKERAQLAELRRKESALAAGADHEDGQTALYLEARHAKRRLFLRDPDLAPLQRILFVKRHPYTPSHNYSDILDSAFRPGGGVFMLELPRGDGRIEPAEGRLQCLFDATSGIARDAVAAFDGSKVYFAFRPHVPAGALSYWHVMEMDADGGHLRERTSGPFQDDYPCPLPDGGLAFVSTRCRSRFLCWRPQAFVLFRMDAGGGKITPLSHANLSEWAPTVMRDGRILWTRSEYLDKGADFGHTLWAIHPDGTHPTLLFGNDTRNCYVGAHEVPGTNEIACTLFSHGGDLNGPIGLIDLSRGPFATGAVTNITPDVAPHYHMSWPLKECFRDSVPIARDHLLVSHAPGDRFGLYVIDRYGNREVLYLDPAIGSMCPTLLRGGGPAGPRAW